MNRSLNLRLSPLTLKTSWRWFDVEVKHKFTLSSRKWEEWFWFSHKTMWQMLATSTFLSNRTTHSPHFVLLAHAGLGGSAQRKDLNIAVEIYQACLTEEFFFLQYFYASANYAKHFWLFDKSAAPGSCPTEQLTTKGTSPIQRQKQWLCSGDVLHLVLN